MTQSRKLYISTILLLIFGIGYNFYKRPYAPEKLASVPVVVELFSSKFCSACPPAERNLATLNKDPNIIALSCHVSYLDFGDNKDINARDFCEVRQHGYANLLTGKHIYTPFMVVNGEKVLTGSNSWSLSSALKNAEQNPPVLIKMTETNDRKIEINLPEIKNSAKLRLWAFGYSNKSSDELKSTTVTNAALSLDNLGAWEGKTDIRQIQMLDKKIHNLVVLAQENSYGRIIAAGRLALR